jgi:hypothetical protein
MKPFVFKKDPSHCNDHKKILKNFERLLKCCDSGAWLIRESRQVGFITLSFNKEGKIEHRRFAFISNEWIEANNLEAAKTIKITPKNESNIGNSSEDLLNKIQDKYNLSFKALQVPSSKAATKASAYLQYVFDEEPAQKKYRDPIGALDKIKQQLENEITLFSVPEASPPTADKFLSYKEAFIDWINKSEHKYDLECPISLAIFTRPYRLSSGYVLERLHCFDDLGQNFKSHCPVTRLALTSEPIPLIGYHKVFEICLEAFSLWHQLTSKSRYLATSAVAEPAPEKSPSRIQLFDLSMFSEAPKSETTAEGTSLSLQKECTP